jgi:hypothetical protein
MKYKFTTSPYGQKDSIMFGVEILDKSIESLREISWDGWTPQEIQMIIDKSKKLQGEEMFYYQVVGSDLSIHIYHDEVYFFDHHTKQKEEDFKWSFNEFIDFMEKFKEFIKENS